MRPENSLALRLDHAHTGGSISSETLAILREANRHRQYDEVPGTKPEDFTPDDVLLTTIFVDDSGSIATIPDPEKRMMLERDWEHPERYEQYTNSEAVRIGQNAVLDTLLDSHHNAGVLVQTVLMNDGPLASFRPLADANNPEWRRVMRLDRGNYRPMAGTPLLDSLLITLTDVLAAHRTYFDDYRNTVRTATLIVTDGLDNNFLWKPIYNDKVVKVRRVLTDLQATGDHLIAGMAIDDGTHQVKGILQDMGVDERWIIEPGSTPDQIRTAFSRFARVAQEATRSENFPMLMAAGFSSDNPNK